MSQCDPTIRTLQSDIDLDFSPQGQMFASRETIRQAIADVLDAGWFQTGIKYHWHFDPNDEGEDETLTRHMFMDLVINRIGQLQQPPHDGIKLENLCPRHKVEALPKPTVQVCVMCEKERGR